MTVVWIVLLQGGYDLPEAFGPFNQHEDAMRFHALAENHGVFGDVVAMLAPDEFSGWKRESPLWTAEHEDAVNAGEVDVS